MNGSIKKLIEKLKNVLKNENGKTTYQKSMGYHKRSTNREIYSNKCLHHKSRKFSNKQLNGAPQGTIKARTK